MQKFYHGSFVQDIFGVSNLSLFIMHLCKQLLGCKFRCFVSHGNCLSPLWNFGRKSKTTSLYEPMSFLLMMLLTITPKTPHTHTHTHTHTHPQKKNHGYKRAILLKKGRFRFEGTSDSIPTDSITHRKSRESECTSWASAASELNQISYGGRMQ